MSENFLKNFKDNNLSEKIMYLLTTVEDGYTDVVDVYLHLDELSKMIEKTKSNLKEQVISKVKEQENNKLNQSGYTLKLVQSGKYSYKHITEWVNYDTKRKSIEKIAKDMYNNNHSEFIDTETGEIILAAKYKPNKIGVKALLND